MSSAQQEAVSRKAYLAGNGCSFFKRYKAADGYFLVRPKGVPPVRHLGVAGLDKGTTIACDLRLNLEHWGNSELIHTTLSEYKMIALRSVFTRSFLTERNTDRIPEARKFLVGSFIGE